MPFPDDSIDVVFGIAILHHLDLDLVSREVRRVLKPGGRAIFQEPVRNSRGRPLRPLADSLSGARHLAVRAAADRRRVRALRDRIQYWSVRAVRPAARADRQVLPVVKNYWKALYEMRPAVLHRAPWLARYASIRVISLTK